MRDLALDNLANIADAAWSAWELLLEPLPRTSWTAGRGFWLHDILDDRFLVAYFLPFAPLLILLRRDRLRLGILLTGLVFLTYVFGALYAAFWLLSCCAFHRLAERFACECRRTDVWPLGPPVAAGLFIGGWFLATQAIQTLPLPLDLMNWFSTHTPWIYPLGARGWSWEPIFNFPRTNAGGPVSLPRAVFHQAHAIGTAYLAIRLFCYFSDIKRGALPPQRRTLLNFLAYTCYAPALIQGPLERFATFQDEMDTCHLRRSWSNLPPALARIALGIAKSLVATLYLFPILHERLDLGGDNTYYANPERIDSFLLLYSGDFLSLLWLYLEFSGYCDIAAGIARLFGYRQIENFNWPWAATSMRDLWRRWHISLSFILRDYVYIPLGGNRRHTTLNLCIAFGLCGLWHVPVPKWGLWGVVMGLMVAVNQAWAHWMRQLAAAPRGALPALRRAALKLQPLPRIAGWLLTMHAFVFSTTIFAGGANAPRLWREILRRLWHAL